MASGKIHIIKRTYTNHGYSSNSGDFKVRDTYNSGDYEVITFKKGEPNHVAKIVEYSEGTAFWGSKDLAFINEKEEFKAIPYSKLAKRLYKGLILAEDGKWMIVMKKFKIGDTVKKDEDIGRVVGIDSECYFILFEDNELNQNTYYADTGGNYSELYDFSEADYTNDDELNISWGFKFHKVKRVTIPDSKLARNIYKNR